MKNPLRKRIPRELKGEIGKYLVIFLLMLGTIGMVSGFLVADGSMIKAYNESFEKYNIEDEKTNDKSIMLLCGIGTSTKNINRLFNALNRIK